MPCLRRACAGDFQTLKNFGVRDFVLPRDVKEVSKAPEIETVHLFFMAFGGGPCFAAVQYDSEDDSSVDFESGFQANSSPIPDCRSKSPKCADGF